MKHSDYPAIYQSASDLSESAQNAFYRAFLSHMGLLAIASAISVANSSCPELAILQALVLFGALGCAVYLYLGRPDRHWYSGRAVAESIKTSTWRYISRAEPFDGLTELDRHNFELKVRAILDQNKDVAGLLCTHLDGLQISDEMNRLRKEPIDERQNYYRTHRILEQQSWYANKASTNKKMVNRYFFALLLVIAYSGDRDR